MSLAMSSSQRQAFLAGVHVGIVSVADGDRGPIATPVWYSYEPGGAVRILTGPNSRKAVAARHAGRISLCVQSEALPYRYVSVEGPVTFEPPAPGETLSMAIRYLGTEGGGRYAAGSSDADSIVLVLIPERWLSQDYGKTSLQ
jgi:hypothetical protein